MRALPPLDLHAHVDPRISPEALAELNSVVFAVTRSLEEAEAALDRNDTWTTWGVGCHPSLQGAHNTFQAERFEDLIQHTAFVSEVGLDGQSTVPMETQVQTLSSMLQALGDTPRLTSIHSYGAREEVLTALERMPVDGAILHWWLGTRDQTQRALDLGCYFSVNPAAAARSDVLAEIPLNRVLTETDHPYGDRGSAVPRPGGVAEVEEALAEYHGLSSTEVRFAVWENFARLAQRTRCTGLLPRSVRIRLAAL